MIKDNSIIYLKVKKINYFCELQKKVNQIENNENDIAKTNQLAASNKLKEELLRQQEKSARQQEEDNNNQRQE